MKENMMNYCIDHGNPYPAKAFMIVADDDEREWGTANWEEKSAQYYAQGYTPVSMKRDFATIYQNDVSKASEQYKPVEVKEAA